MIINSIIKFDEFEGNKWMDWQNLYRIASIAEGHASKRKYITQSKLRGQKRNFIR